MYYRKDIWIAEECSNPSTEYYLLPALKISGFEHRVKILNHPPPETIEDDIVIIFVRYLNKKWINFIERNRKKIKKIIYFMDDDLFDLKSLRHLPFGYIKKIYLKALRWKRWLLKVKSDFFVSTDYLSAKYNYLNPLILPPYPIFDTPSSKLFFQNSNMEKRRKESIIVFYHATASHRREIDWLYDVVKGTLSENEMIIYEFIGTDTVYNKFKSLERVIVVHPMRWELYKNFLLTKRRHIGLVPIIDNSFNRARNYTKFFEIVSCGAIGIFSKESCYKKIISHERDGILILNNKANWIESIIKLAEDDSWRLKLYFSSSEKLKMLKEFAERTYKENLTRRLE